jgi:hypothetical protein
MFRIVAWSLLALFLLLVGAWPAAAAPIVLASAGAAVVVGKSHGVVLLGIAAVLYLRRKPAPAAVRH